MKKLCMRDCSVCRLLSRSDVRTNGYGGRAGLLCPRAAKEHSTMPFQAKITAGTLSNTVSGCKPFGLYVLSATITVPAGKKLTIVAADPGTTQQTAPPMICWTPSTGVSTTFNFDCYGDIYMKNIWLLYATTNTDGARHPGRARRWRSMRTRPIT